MVLDKAKITGRIKSLAGEFGFSACGIAAAQKLDDEAIRLQEWLDRKFHGSMNYLPDRLPLRIDPQALMPGARSVISLLYNYYPENHPTPKAKFIISKYAYGRDYHRVIRSILKKMVEALKKEAVPLFKLWAERHNDGKAMPWKEVYQKLCGVFTENMVKEDYELLIERFKEVLLKEEK